MADEDMDAWPSRWPGCTRRRLWPDMAQLGGALAAPSPSMLPPRRCVNAWPRWPWCCLRWRRGRWATCSGWSSGAPRSSIALRGVWAQRWRGGHVRECHGDLHLANIAWIDGQPQLFDALEFNPICAGLTAWPTWPFGDGPASAWAV